MIINNSQIITNNSTKINYTYLKLHIYNLIVLQTLWGKCYQFYF